MYESQDNTELFSTDYYGVSDSDIPEPVEHWSLEDFTDILKSA